MTQNMDKKIQLWRQLDSEMPKFVLLVLDPEAKHDTIIDSTSKIRALLHQIELQFEEKVSSNVSNRLRVSCPK